MKIRIVAILAIIMLIFAYTYTSGAANLTELNTQKEEAESELESVQEEKSTAESELETLKAQVSSLESEIATLENKLSELNTTIAEKEAEITQKEEELAEKQELLNKRLVAMYKSGGTSYLDVLLGSDNYIEMLSKLNAVNKIAESDTKLINEVAEEKATIEAEKVALEASKAELETTKSELSTKKASLSAAQTAKQEAINSLSAEEQELETKIAEFEAAIEKAQEEIRKAAQAAISSSGSYTGSFEGVLAWPVSSSSYGYNIITSIFGNRTAPTAGASTNHGAIDIGVSYVPVLAPAAGKVIIAGYVSGYGNYIMIDHGNGYYTAFGHLSSFNVSVGDVVSSGQQIAVSGNTGISTGPHLHYEVYIGGTSKSYRVDPLSYTTHGTLYYQ